MEQMMSSQKQRSDKVAGLSAKDNVFFSWYWQGGALELMEAQAAHFRGKRVTERVLGEFSSKWLEEAFAKHLEEVNPWSFANVQKVLAAKEVAPAK
jgi:hypothetical protein